MVKHVKLFENWAEEDISLPEWLDPEWDCPDDTTFNIFDKIVKKRIQCDEGQDLRLGTFGNNIQVNFKSFSDYNFWNKTYTNISIRQERCAYRLEDCYGVPECSTLELYNNKIKSLKGLKPSKPFSSLSIKYACIENLKYCPASAEYNFTSNPLLSFFGIGTDDLDSVNLFKSTLNVECVSNYLKYSNNERVSSKDMNDPKFSAEVFSYFTHDAKMFREDIVKYINPWTQIYEDPNEVENYDFLFIPFYINNETFRERVKQYTPHANLSGISLGKEELW